MLSTGCYPRAGEIWEDLTKKEKYWPAWKICINQQTRSPRSRRNPWDSKTNVAPLTAHLGRRRNQSKKIKQMVRTGLLLSSTNILTPSLLQIPRRRLFCNNWLDPMQPSPQPTPNFRLLWPASLRPTINSLVGWETAKAIKTKTPGPKKILLPTLRLYVPIVN